MVVLALGWAGSEELVEHLLLPEECDVVCLFDYRDLTLSDGLFTELEAYAERYLMGWSFGVWAATRLFGMGGEDSLASALTWRGATAVNGTPAPVDDGYGIPKRGYELTARGIQGVGTRRFLERMCGSPEVLEFYYRHRSTRPLDEIGEELAALGKGAERGLVLPGGTNLWTRAVVGGRDAIFPPENMARYWAEAGVTTVLDPDMPHYPFYNEDLLADLVHEAR